MLRSMPVARNFSDLLRALGTEAPRTSSRALATSIDFGPAFAGVDVLFGNDLNRLPPLGQVRLELSEDSCQPAEI